MCVAFSSRFHVHFSEFNVLISDVSVTAPIFLQDFLKNVPRTVPAKRTTVVADTAKHAASRKDSVT